MKFILQIHLTKHADSLKMPLACQAGQSNMLLHQVAIEHWDDKEAIAGSQVGDPRCRFMTVYQLPTYLYQYILVYSSVL